MYPHLGVPLHPKQILSTFCPNFDKLSGSKSFIQIDIINKIIIINNYILLIRLILFIDKCMFFCHGDTRTSTYIETLQYCNYCSSFWCHVERVTTKISKIELNEDGQEKVKFYLRKIFEYYEVTVFILIICYSHSFSSSSLSLSLSLLSLLFPFLLPSHSPFFLLSSFLSLLDLGSDI